MNVDVLALVKLQKLYDLVSFCLETFELHLLGGQHELSAKSPGSPLAWPMHQLVRTGVFPLIVVL
jgi:hypothetical protein